jgi:hypothetical protein
MGLWIVLAVLLAFFVWVGWVLSKLSPNRPGGDTPRKDLGLF